MSTFSTSAGTTLSISASLPGAYTQGGYEALSFTEVTGITDLGEIPDEVFEVVRVQPIATGKELKSLGGSALGNQTIQFPINPDDPGQAVLAQRTGNKTAASIKIDHPELGTIYASALIVGGPKNYGDANSASMKSSTLEYTYGPNGEPPVLVDPA